ncbi:MAG: DUF1837 domain-containing protein [Patescibacteria group bacterium]
MTTVLTFKSDAIVNEHISEADLRAYVVGFDLGEFRYDKTVDIFLDGIVDFAFGYHEGILTESYNKRILVEAAKSIYKIKTNTTAGELEIFNEAKKHYVDNDLDYDDDVEEKYLKRGEFGELILHILSRDFLKTIPLISKIYFKDADGVTVHGFDSVHIGPCIGEPGRQSLYLGESKLYNDGAKGVKALIEDIKSHFNLDFLEREFVLISKRKSSFSLPEDIINPDKKEAYQSFLKEKDDWLVKLGDIQSGKVKMEEVLKCITVPVLCTYTSEVFNKHNDEGAEAFKKEYEEEIRKLKEIFDEKLQSIRGEGDVNARVKTNLNILLMLFPVPSKKELVKRLHIKLNHQQNA